MGSPQLRLGPDQGLRRHAARRLLQHDLLTQCSIFRQKWYIPEDILKLVSAPTHTGYTHLGLAAKARGLESCALMDALKKKGSSKFTTLDGELYVGMYSLTKNDEIDRHFETLQPDERDRRKQLADQPLDPRALRLL